MKKYLLSAFTILSASAVFAQIPNNGFETWGQNFGAPQEPSSYISANVFASPFISPSNPTSVTQAGGGDQYNGNYAAKITTVKVTSNPSGGAIPDTVGVLLLGQVALAPSPALKSGTGWTSRLYSVDFMYKYAPVNGDNGAVASYLTKWNGTSRDTLASAYYPFTTTVSSYTPGSAPFNYDNAFPANATPDTLHLYFLSSARPWLPTLPSYAQVGSALWVDDATVVGIKGSTKLFGSSVKSYPNPATNYFTVSADESAVSVEVYDVTGNLISTGNFADKKAKIETSAFAPGIYLYSVKDENKKVIATGKVNVTK